MLRAAIVVFFTLIAGCAEPRGAVDNAAPAAGLVEADWPHYGGALDGARFSAAADIDRDNVGKLVEAWRYRSGDATNGDGYFGRKSSFKATPVLAAGKLIFPTGFNRIIALDPKTGAELWRFDPKVDFSRQYSEMFTARGVAVWRGGAAAGAACETTVFFGTLDARLIGIDAHTGARCKDFAENGEINLANGVKNFRAGDYSVTSAPLVINDLVIVGSSIGDNGGVDLDAGIVRAFDTITGALRWTWDPLPRSPTADGAETWAAGDAGDTGAANVWTAMAADAERGLVYLPTSSPSPDFYGGARLGDGKHANSIVALDAETGGLVWAYQIVRHDLWDYDLASQPMLADIEVNGEKRPALALATKMGFVFVLDRETGAPLIDVEERATPQSDVPGEQAAATQKFPKTRLHSIEADIERWSDSPAHKARCDAMLEGIRYDGIFTPPSLEGTLLFPGNPGGVNWGSMAYNPARKRAFVAVNRLPTAVKLIPRDEFAQAARIGIFNGVDAQFTAQSGAPYGMARFEVYDRETGLFCFKGPWATLAAIDIETGDVAWETPVGAAPTADPDSEASGWGYFASGGPLAVAGDVVFLATPHDFTLRAHDVTNGATLWSAQLPAQPHATPMAYKIDGVQYVVIAAGGDLADGEGRGDYLIAFKLPAD